MIKKIINYKTLTLITLPFFLIANLYLFFLDQSTFKNEAGIKKSYFFLKKLANQKLKDNDEIKQIIFKKSANKLNIKKIYKKPIGVFEDNYIDQDGNLFKSKQTHSLIKVSGKYDLWPEVLKSIRENQLESIIYEVKIINKERIDLWVLPGTLIQIQNNLEDLKKLISNFPKVIKKDYLIDLRIAKRIGISKINKSKMKAKVKN